MYAFVVGLGVLLLACIADVVTTLRGLRVGMVERNLLVRWATNWPWLLWPIKLVFVGGATWQLWTVYHRYPRTAFVCAIVAGWITGFVAVRNARMAESLRRDAREQAWLRQRARLWELIEHTHEHSATPH